MATDTPNNPSRDQVATGKLFAEMMNLIENTRQKQAETQKLSAETKWYPVRYLGGVFIAAVVFWGAVIAAVKAFLP